MATKLPQSLPAGEQVKINKMLNEKELRRQGGRRHRLPKRLVADKGYSSRKFRTYLRNHRIGCTIPHKDNELHEEEWLT